MWLQGNVQPEFERLRRTGEEPFALDTCYLLVSEFSGLVNSP